MARARSRLQKSDTKNKRKISLAPIGGLSWNVLKGGFGMVGHTFKLLFKLVLATIKRILIVIAVIGKRYIRYFPSAIVATLGWTAVWFIFSQRSPATIANYPFPNSYGLLLGSFWLATFFTTSFLLLHSRRGWWISCWASLSLWLRLVDVQPWWLLTLLILIYFVTIEGSISFFEYIKNVGTTKRKTATSTTS